MKNILDEKYFSCNFFAMVLNESCLDSSVLKDYLDSAKNDENLQNLDFILNQKIF